MTPILIKNASIVNENNIFMGSVFLQNNLIAKIFEGTISTEQIENLPSETRIIDAIGQYLLPGIIDDQVHFREPGLTHKGTIHSESRAAVAGGITSYMEMPNTVPNVFTQQLLEEKYQLAANSSFANYSFFMGASNTNLEEVLKTNPQNVCGIKVFMGSSTGNMLVDNRETLEALFAKSKMLIALHCEDEKTIRENLQVAKNNFGEQIPVQQHPVIRSAEACYLSSSLAVELARKHNTRIHILHISTAKETSLFESKPLREKRITAEACVHHLWFCDDDYQRLGNFIKWNPAIKSTSDRNAIWKALLDNRIDVVATDHAPHTIAEKQNSYLTAPSGGPLVQHSLVAMLEFHHQKKISLQQVVTKMCHNVAELFQIEKRGFIRESYYADLVLVDLNSPWTVTKSNILAACGWSPFEGVSFQSKVTHTFVNGQLVFENGTINESIRGQRLLFTRS
ncbi:MAG: dihydroorotase [Bacteroidetes bacterium]|nr:dihydroorotase [Bacteroidota bacterium]